jgi:hypothetical protein
LSTNDKTRNGKNYVNAAALYDLDGKSLSRRCIRQKRPPNEVGLEILRRKRTIRRSRRGWRKKKLLPTCERETRPEVVEFGFKMTIWMMLRKSQMTLPIPSNSLEVQHLRVM